MGAQHPLDDTGHTECDPACPALHLPPENVLATSQGSRWERIQVAGRGSHAREQMCVTLVHLMIRNGSHTDSGA